MTPAEIAARLTPAQRTVIMRAPIRSDSARVCEARFGLWLYGALDYGRLTPLGLQVRAILAAEAQRDG